MQWGKHRIGLSIHPNTINIFWTVGQRKGPTYVVQSIPKGPDQGNFLNVFLHWLQRKDVVAIFEEDDGFLSRF
jgi:hypothetical protein